MIIIKPEWDFQNWNDICCKNYGLLWPFVFKGVEFNDAEKL